MGQTSDQHASALAERISGTTRVVAIIGDPIAQVRAPGAFGALFEAQAIDAVCVAMHVGPDGLEAAIAGMRGWRNLVGLSVTIPHKGPICRYLDALSERARRVGVVNAVRREPDGRLVGDIFDGEGFVGGLRREGIAVDGASAWLVGAGGAGTAIAFALVEHGIRRLTLTDTNTARAEALAARLGAERPGCAVVAQGVSDPVDIAINATPLGMRAEDPLPFDPAPLAATTVVAEVIMKPPTTRLLRAAVRLGRRIHRGHHMLDNQIDLYAQFLGFDALPRRRPEQAALDRLWAG